MNINGTTLFLFFLSPRVSGGPQKPQTMALTASKSKYEKFGQKIKCLIKKYVFYRPNIFRTPQKMQS